MLIPIIRILIRNLGIIILVVGIKIPNHRVIVFNGVVRIFRMIVQMNGRFVSIFSLVGATSSLDGTNGRVIDGQRDFTVTTSGGGLLPGIFKL